MVSAANEIPLNAIQFDYEDPIQLLEQWDNKKVIQEISKVYFGLDTFEKMNALVEKQDFATVLKHVWTEKKLDKKLEWLRSVEKVANPILLHELAIAELQKSPTTEMIERKVEPLIQLTNHRICQDKTYFNNLNDGLKKKGQIEIKLSSIFFDKLQKQTKYFQIPFAHEIANLFSQYKILEFVKELVSNPSFFKPPLWMKPYLTKIHSKNNPVTVNELKDFYFMRTYVIILVLSEKIEESNADK